ncbi:DUF7503 family protein [Halomicrococcus sp. NG-SE-24]
MAENDLTSYLEENPRMIGAMFTMLLLFSQVGGAAAANQACWGP